MATENFTPKFIIIKLIDEILIESIDNHNNTVTVKEFMYEKFGENNFYIIGENEYGVVFLTIVNRKKEITISLNRFLIYFRDKEPEIYAKLTTEYIPLPFIITGIKELKNYDLYSPGIKKSLTLEKYKYFISIEKLINLQAIDITQNKKYFDWLCKIDLLDKIYSEDFEKTKMLLKDFDKPQVKALIKKSGNSIDINNYSTINNLFSVVKENYYDKLDDVEAGNREILYQKRKLFEDDIWLVVSPNSHEEAVTIGRGSNWCTSADSTVGKSNYDYYTNYGDVRLLIFIDKTSNKKYQYSERTHDFLDENDDEFNFKDTFPIDLCIEYDNIYSPNIPKHFKEYLGNYDKNKYTLYYILSLPESDKHKLIKVNHHLDILAFDDDETIRLKVAEKGVGLEILTNDKEEIVLEEVIRQGYDLDKFIKHENEHLRSLVAEQKYGLEILINDESEYVRKSVAEQEYRLDFLINDVSEQVRAMVASKGYGLDVLVYDESKIVREEVAYNGYGLDILVNDDEYDVRIIIAEAGKYLDILINDDNEIIRLKVAEHNYGWDILINDDSWDIQLFFVQKAYRLDILKNSEYDYISKRAKEKIREIKEN